MKKYTLQIILLIVLVGIILAAQFAPYGTSRIFDMLRIGKKGTINELRDFSVSDTSKVDRIFMVNKESKSIDLVRNDNNKWILNGRYDANVNSVNLLLTTIKRMTIKNPIARSAEETLIKRLATRSVKVEIYQAGSLYKTYYIGGVTQNQMGSYAMIEGSDQIFVVEIPGFRGFISGRFHVNEKEWRSSRVFAFDESEIEKIDVNVGRLPNQSFQIKVKGKSNYELYNFNNQKAHKFDTIVLRRFIREFKKKFFSSFVPFVTKEKVDSLYQSPYFYRYNVSLKNGRSVELSLYRIKDYVPEEDEIDLLNGIINQSDLVYIQTHIFAPLFVELNDLKSDL